MAGLILVLFYHNRYVCPRYFDQFRLRFIYLKPVYILSRHYSIDDNRLGLIIDMIKDPVVSNPNPVTLSCRKLFDAGWSRVLSQKSNNSINSLTGLGRQLINLPVGGMANF